MIAVTTKNCNTVRISADYHLDTAKVYYHVYCHGKTFEFEEFAPAANVYKKLSERIENGEDFKCLLKNLVSAARAMGYKVQEAA